MRTTRIFVFFALTARSHVCPNERADRDHTQVLRVRALEREFNECVAEMSAAKLLGHFRVNQFERLGRSLVDEKRRVTVGRQFETARPDVIDTRRYIRRMLCGCHLSRGTRVSIKPHAVRLGDIHGPPDESAYESDSARWYSAFFAIPVPDHGSGGLHIFTHRTSAIHDGPESIATDVADTLSRRDGD